VKKYICSSSGGGAQEKGKDRMKLSLPSKSMVFSVATPLECSCTSKMGLINTPS
jgi:hypothetical protein